MNVFDDVFGKWIQVVDDKCPLSIEDYGYEAGVIEGTTRNHCVKCVAVNKCWFKDEKDKKPEKFDITNIKVLDLLLKGLMPGLYHSNCHCKEIPIKFISLDDIRLIIPEGKIDWLLKDKLEWIVAMGYKFNENFLKLLYQKIKKAYYLGQYIIQKHDNYGVKIKLKIDIPGEGIKQGKLYSIKSSFMVFPNGKIKCNTLIGGWW